MTQNTGQILASAIPKLLARVADQSLQEGGNQPFASNLIGSILPNPEKEAKARRAAMRAKQEFLANKFSLEQAKINAPLKTANLKQQIEISKANLALSNERLRQAIATGDINIDNARLENQKAKFEVSTLEANHKRQIEFGDLGIKERELRIKGLEQQLKSKEKLDPITRAQAELNLEKTRAELDTLEAKRAIADNLRFEDTLGAGLMDAGLLGLARKHFNDEVVELGDIQKEFLQNDVQVAELALTNKETAKAFAFNLAKDIIDGGSRNLISGRMHFTRTFVGFKVKNSSFIKRDSNTNKPFIKGRDKQKEFLLEVGDTDPDVYKVLQKEGTLDFYIRQNLQNLMPDIPPQRIKEILLGANARAFGVTTGSRFKQNEKRIASETKQLGREMTLGSEGGM